jgi:hypothetical protein
MVKSFQNTVLNMITDPLVYSVSLADSLITLFLVGNIPYGAPDEELA